MHCDPLIQNLGWALAHVVGPGPKGLSCSAPMGSGRRCKLSHRGPGRRGRSPDRSRILLYCMLSKRIWLQHVWFFGQHCNSHGKMKEKSRLRSNLVSAGNLRHINIIHSRSKWQVNFCKVRNCGPPKFCGPVRPNTSNMPKAGPVDRVSRRLYTSGTGNTTFLKH